MQLVRRPRRKSDFELVAKQLFGTLHEELGTPAFATPSDAAFANPVHLLFSSFRIAAVACFFLSAARVSWETMALVE